MITLIIVDCQVDFIWGSMSVNGAAKAVENIVSYIERNKKLIGKVIFTADWHPIKHCSFIENGGQWPEHCVNYTTGASIATSLIRVVEDNNILYSVYFKGQNAYMEEYGAFAEADCKKPDTHILINRDVTINLNTDIVVCGIAGDYCVSETIRNLYQNIRISPKVFLDGVASIDNGSIISSLIKEYNLETI